MRLLLDTHVLLWVLEDGPIEAEALKTIRDGGAEVNVSAATIWEAEIKAASGRLELAYDLLETVRSRHLIELPVTADHAQTAARLPPYHRDPFDRMLIAQARLEQLTLVTRDPVFERYGLSLLAA